MSAEDESRDVVRELHEAMAAVRCPYHRMLDAQRHDRPHGDGTCRSGCHYEPLCDVNTPIEGWPAVIRRARAELRA